MALFDFPWIPFYLGICFLFHVWIGLAATIGGLTLVFLTYLTEVRTRGPTRAAVSFAATRNALAEAGRRNAEVLQAMGMAGRVGAVWARTNSEYMASQRRATDVAGGLGALSKVFRLLDGTVAENIARFHAEADPTAIIAAAKQAGVNDLILRLPQGYETRIGEGGMALSAGQRQRVALARALYGDPFLVVLDEPNSNLDHEGEEALTKAISGVRTRGGIVIVVSHRASALASVDLILVMKEGKTQAFGPRDEVMAKLIRRFPAPVAPATPLRVVAESGQAS
jgi:ABC-type protease/lipase transport system fused ATPase/permease subunit